MERQVITMMLQFPEIIDDVKNRRFMDHFADDELAKSEGALSNIFHVPVVISPVLYPCWEDTEKKAVIARLSLTDEQWDRKGCEFDEPVRRHDTAQGQIVASAY
jgi:DNA primase